MQQRPLQRRQQKPRDRRQPYKVRCSDDTAIIDLIFFHAHEDYLLRMLPVGEQRLVSGKIERFKDKLQMAHPDYIVALNEEASLPTQEPVYALTEGLPGKTLLKAIRAAVEKVPALPEWQDEAYRQRHGWPDFAEALRTLHHPETPAA